jgi:hypothetical protein
MEKIMKITEKIDLKKELKHLYAPSSRSIEIVDVPEAHFATVTGQLRPHETPEYSLIFQNSLQAMYAISFTLKFMSKMRKKNPIDYTVMALEGIWWTQADEFEFDKSKTWQFRLLMLQPKHITHEMFTQALQKLREKKDNPALAGVRFESFKEGLCIQTMHVGPYDREPQTIQRMKCFADENELKYCGRHHEIYLGDPRRCAPEKLRTILRHPVSRI